MDIARVVDKCFASGENLALLRELGQSYLGFVPRISAVIFAR